MLLQRHRWLLRCYLCVAQSNPESGLCMNIRFFFFLTHRTVCGLWGDFCWMQPKVYCIRVADCTFKIFYSFHKSPDKTLFTWDIFRNYLWFCTDLFSSPLPLSFSCLYRLVSALTLLSKKLNCYKITLECAPNNVAFYQKFGYTASHETYMQCRFSDWGQQRL